MPQKANNASVAGVDGARGRWIVALVDGDSISFLDAATVDDVLTLTEQCAAVGVDMPLGMPDSGYRTCELDARVALGAARSSIFFTPVRPVLEAATWEEACVISRSVTSKAISKQSWYLLPHIRAWDSAQFDRNRVVEVHPESTFRAMAPGRTFASKKTARGMGQRLAALAALAPADSLLRALGNVPDGPAVDDVLDAAAAAWSARRWADRTATVFGDGSVDSAGHPLRIVV